MLWAAYLTGHCTAVVPLAGDQIRWPFTDNGVADVNLIGEEVYTGSQGPNKPYPGSFCKSEFLGYAPRDGSAGFETRLRTLNSGNTRWPSSF